MKTKRYPLTSRGLPHCQGVYLLRVGPHIYVGSTSDLAHRTHLHKSQFLNAKNKKRLQAAFDEDGMEACTIEMLEMVPRLPWLRKREEYWISQLHPDLNAKGPVRRVVNNERDRKALGQSLIGKLLGRHHTEETRRRIGEAHKGRHLSVETRKRMSGARKIYWDQVGRSMTPRNIRQRERYQRLRQREAE